MERKSKKVAIYGVYGAIIAILGLTPLGFIPVGFTNATTMHIPVIIAGILEGPVGGALVGLFFGIFSMINALIKPNPLSIIFLNPIVAILPRILIGLVSAYSYKIIKNISEKNRRKVFIFIFALISAYFIYWLAINIFDNEVKVLSKVINSVLLVVSLAIMYTVYKNKNENSLDLAIPAALGAFTNTFFVLSLMYIIYGSYIEQAMKLNAGGALDYIKMIAMLNAGPEIIASVILVSAICLRIKKNNDVK